MRRASNQSGHLSLTMELVALWLITGIGTAVVLFALRSVDVIQPLGLGQALAWHGAVFVVTAVALWTYSAIDYRATRKRFDDGPE